MWLRKQFTFTYFKKCQRTQRLIVVSSRLELRSLQQRGRLQGLSKRRAEGGTVVEVHIRAIGPPHQHLHRHRNPVGVQMKTLKPQGGGIGQLADQPFKVRGEGIGQGGAAGRTVQGNRIRWRGSRRRRRRCTA